MSIIFNTPSKIHGTYIWYRITSICKLAHTSMTSYSMTKDHVIKLKALSAKVAKVAKASNHDEIVFFYLAFFVGLLN